MADFCVDCTREEFDTLEGAHDFPNGRAWQVCEGCGMHIFHNGVRVCRRGAFSVGEACASTPCEECASFMGTDEGV